jgi:predicted nucleic acid-binding protein
MLHLKEAYSRGIELTVPTVVVAEVWRGGARSARIAALLEACVVEPLGEELSKLAGEALATVRGASVADAIVMGSAARRGDRVLTADFDDLERLRDYFPSVRLVRV